MPIHKLSEEVIGQIAAGEVVERPASVVKELVENALDAGASNIHVEISEGGQRLIRVSDDGSGILADEAELALARHATSKLQSAADLYQIKTLGFRGEALSSIAAVSHLTLTTRQRSDSVGVQLRTEGGMLRKQEPVGVPAGTVVSVENLFFNTPARLKFLKAEATEKRLISTIVTRYAMAYPHVRFVLVQDGREAFRSAGSGQLADVLVQVLGLESFREMVEVSGQEVVRPLGVQVGIYGFTSTADLHRKDRTRIVFFVNGRNVTDTGLTYAVTQAYHMLLEKGRYPIAVLLLDLPPDFVDVNVHPTKAEVRFQDSNVVFVSVQRFVRQAVVGVAARAGLYQTQANRDDNDNAWNTRSNLARAQQLDLDLHSDDYGTATDDERGRIHTSNDPTAIPEGPERPQKPRTLPVLRVVGQVGATYIVAEGPAGLYLVNQHHAHHRILYEQQLEHVQQAGQVPQTELAEARTIDLSAREAALLEKHLHTLAEVGFSVDAFGGNTFMVRALPTVAAGCDPADVLRAMIPELNKQGEEMPLDRRLLLRACEQAAIKTGQVLTTETMQGLIRQLERTHNPRFSPDGKPTLVHFSAEHLAREFGLHT